MPPPAATAFALFCLVYRAVPRLGLRVHLEGRDSVSSSTSLTEPFPALVKLMLPESHRNDFNYLRGTQSAKS